VDSGNHRIQIFDPETHTLHGVLGAPGVPRALPPSSAPGRFNTPWSIAADFDGNVYVVDYGNHRVQKFDSVGQVDPLFWERMQSESLLTEPAEIAVFSGEATVRVFVLDRAAKRVYQFDQHGTAIRDDQAQAWRTDALGEPMGLAATADSLYVGDNSLSRILKFRTNPTPRRIGQAVGFEGRVAALALNGKGELLVHGGGSAAHSADDSPCDAEDGHLPDTPLALTESGYAGNGLLWGGPFSVDCPELNWHRVHATATVPERGAHLQFFWRLGPANAAPPVNPASDDPYPAPEWQEVPPDLTDFFAGGDRTLGLWIGVRFSSDGSATAALSQLRTDFDRDAYIKDLPAIYQQDTSCDDFLNRYLALFESFFHGAEEQTRDLPLWFDPSATPVEALPWLASWLGLTLDRTWSEEFQRNAIQNAFERYAQRGTPRGLRETIEREAGVPVSIEEPIQNAEWWVLPALWSPCGCGESRQWSQPENSVLGWTTMLAPAEAQGVVLGTTAAMDRSHLITGEELGVPLFDDVAHQFRVLIYPADAARPTKLNKVREIVEREKPAHVTYSVCVVRPQFRVGFQARVGIDAIVSSGPSPTRLDEQEVSGTELVLGGEPRGRIGSLSEVGVTSRL
jgi:phage tail-like protein